MKKLKVFLSFVIFGIILFPITLLAQGSGTVTPDVTSYFASLVGVAALSTLVVGFIKKILNVTGIVAQIISWVIAIGLCFLGWALKFGLFANIVLWYVPIIYGVAVGLVSNGIFSIDLVKAFLRLIKLEPPEVPVK